MISVFDGKADGRATWL